MKLFLCESGGHRAVIAAVDEDRARVICALAEMEKLGIGRQLGEEEVAENLAPFADGWRAEELVVPERDGIVAAWWQEP